jgi:pantetheine-phosphate adenylyltransferase
MQYKRVALGGTFDHFHAGHQAFLQHAASLGETLVIGVTHPDLTKNKVFPQLIESYAVRSAAVEMFCKKNNWHAEIIELTNTFGPTITDLKIDALCVTEDTLHGAEVINKKRLAVGLTALRVEKAPLFYDTGHVPISSERIRSGQISRDGLAYKSIFTHSLSLNDVQRNYFSKVQGEIVSVPAETDNLRIVVGDTVLENFIENGWHYDVGVFDFLKRRLPYAAGSLHTLTRDLQVTNFPQQITTELVAALQTAILGNSKYILVDGEEDLAAVAAVLLAPLNSSIYYGQPDTGMVQMIATEAQKSAVYKILHG